MRFILIIAALLSMSISVSAKSKVDSLYNVRNYVIKEMLNYGFHVDKSNGKTTLLTHYKGPGNFRYQAVITVKIKKLVMFSLLIAPEGTNKSWIKEPWQAKEHMTLLWNYALAKYRKEPFLEVRMRNWKSVKTK